MVQLKETIHSRISVVAGVEITIGEEIGVIIVEIGEEDSTQIQEVIMEVTEAKIQTTGVEEAVKIHRTKIPTIIGAIRAKIKILETKISEIHAEEEIAQTQKVGHVANSHRILSIHNPRGMTIGILAIKITPQEVKIIEIQEEMVKIDQGAIIDKITMDFRTRQITKVRVIGVI